MRGKGISNICYHKPRGITPAYAGKSLMVIANLISGQDHPRLCGEKFFRHPQRHRVPGSPPPMRGKAGFSGLQYVLYRITPAYAGKSPRNRSPQWLCRDHPRLCGEKYGICGRTGRNPGITPAYAGKRSMKSVLNAIMQDHPRLCGEKQRLRGLPAGNGGSPPPMRGKVRGCCTEGCEYGITPAYAGKSRN